MIRRTQHSAQKKFAIVTRSLAQDKRLSFQARGLLLYVLSKSEGWEAKDSDLMRQGGIKKHAYASILKELKEYGYARRIEARGKAGKFEYSLEIHEEPTLTDAQPLPDYRTTDDRVADGPPTDNQPAAIDKDCVRAHTAITPEIDSLNNAGESGQESEQPLPPVTSTSRHVSKRALTLVPRDEGAKAPKSFLFPERLNATEEITEFAARHGYEGDDLRNSIESMRIKRLRDDKRYRDERELALDIQYWIKQCAQNRDKRREANYG